MSTGMGHIMQKWKRSVNDDPDPIEVEVKVLRALNPLTQEQIEAFEVVAEAVARYFDLLCGEVEP